MRIHRQHKLCAALGNELLGQINLVFLDERLACLASFSQRKCVGHCAADEHMVADREEIVDHRNLVRHLLSAQNSNEWPLGSGDRL